MSNPFTAVLDLLRREPAIITTVVGAGVAIGASFGLNLSAHQTQEVMGGAATLTALLIRSKVTPSVTVESRLSALETAVSTPSTGTVPIVSPETSPTVAPMLPSASATAAAPVIPAQWTSDQVVAFLTQLAESVVLGDSAAPGTPVVPAAVMTNPSPTPVGTMTPGPVPAS